MAGFLDKMIGQWHKKDTWPPPKEKKRWEQIKSNRERYENDRAAMIRANPNIALDDHKVEIFVPIPWPRELSRFSAALLFSQTPAVQILEQKETVEKLLKVNDLGKFCLRGGVKVSAEGSIAIRIIRDPAISPTPLLTLVEEDQVVWDERHGEFIVGGMVIITRNPNPEEKDQTYRLLEEHTIGQVKRTLWRGDGHHLGKQVSLTDLDEFAQLPPLEQTGLSRPTLVRWQNNPEGESDYFGLTALFDELNEAESLMLDRGRKSIPRVFVDRSLADETGRLKLDGFIFTGGSKMRLPLGTTPGSTIETVVPGFLAAQHIQWIDHIEQLMVMCVGYAPLTWGIQGKTASVTRAVSGYAMKLAQLRTLLNRAGKEHMALEVLGWAIATAVAWMVEPGDVEKFLPTIELGDGLPDDPLDGAQEVLFLHQALAASTETMVRTVHSNWSDDEVEAEVERILEENENPLMKANGIVQNTLPPRKPQTEPDEPLPEPDPVA